jgi:hypothetical protein
MFKTIVVALLAVACSTAQPPPTVAHDPLREAPGPRRPPKTVKLPELPYCLPAALLTVDRECAEVCISDGWGFGSCDNPKPCAVIRDGGAAMVLVLDPDVTKPEVPPPTITGRECPPNELEI